MKRAQSMAQAAWTTRPSLHLSSWSCIGPRHRNTTACSDSADGSSPTSSSRLETSEPLLSPKNSTRETIELPVSSEEAEWTSEIGYFSDEMPKHIDVEAELGGEEFRSNSREDRMNEVELWQQLEHELYDRADGEDADVAKEIREEEAAAMAEIGEREAENTAPETKEAHRFFPPGKIMHIVTFQHDSSESEGDSPSSSDSENTQPQGEDKVGIFVTPRSLYSKVRLSQTMISDHFMPVYRRQIEKLIKELEQEATDANHYCSENSL